MMMRRGPIMRKPDCHPERRHAAKGFCYSCYHIQWRKKHAKPGSLRDSRRHEQKRRWQWKSNLAKFGLTAEGYYARLNEQGGGCAICNRVTEANGRRLPVDHNHTTNAVRGILCNRCNTGVGYLDKPEWLDKAMAYLRQDVS